MFGLGSLGLGVLHRFFGAQNPEPQHWNPGTCCVAKLGLSHPSNMVPFSESLPSILVQ